MYALVFREFESYYQADELVWEDLAFIELAKNSAYRLSFFAKKGNLQAVVAVLQEARSDKAGKFVEDLERETNVDWREGGNWEVFQNQVDMILKFLDESRERPEC